VRHGRAVLTVEDDGPGFGARNPEELFEKFERGQKESPVSGVGLGLAICRAIVHLHGGEIRASNRDTGGGARFEFTLPLESAVTLETAEAEIS
jgi:two-component system sensor histidine kinase KdpD